MTIGTPLFLFARRLRSPLIVLIAVYAIGILGLVIIPARDAAGNAAPMSFFHAFYFLSYTATTIGYGELPNAFTDAQRLWVTVVIYLSVLGWAYLIATLIALLHDRVLTEALRVERVRQEVRRLHEPFFIVCGFGETGALIHHAIDHAGYRCVAVDIDPARFVEIDLVHLKANATGLVADVRNPAILIDAGLQKPECQGVLALTNDDHANLAVALAVRLLKPAVPVLARSQSPATTATMQAFGTDHIVNPFATFGAYLSLAMQSPGSYRLLSWLTDLPGTTLDAETCPPRGRWIVCGYGQFGREVVDSLRREVMPLCIVDPAPAPDATSAAGLEYVCGPVTDRDTLISAGIADAVGIVAGTGDDVTNLAIAITARTINPRLYVILRQRLRASQPLTDAYDADIVMVASEIVAHECIAVLRTPLLARYLAVVRARDDAWADAVVARLEATLGTVTPELWTVRLTDKDAPAIAAWTRTEAAKIRLSELSRDPADRDSTLACVPLLVARGGADPIAMPDLALELASDDAVLFAGTPAARHAQAQMLVNINVRDYVLSGREVPGGLVWEWLAKRRERRGLAAQS